MVTQPSVSYSTGRCNLLELYSSALCGIFKYDIKVQDAGLQPILKCEQNTRVDETLVPTR